MLYHSYCCKKRTTSLSGIYTYLADCCCACVLYAPSEHRMAESGSLGGYRGFFEQLASFLDSSRAHIDTASEEYCEFTLEVLATCVVNVERVLRVFQSASREEGSSFTDDELHALQEYCSVLTELVDMSQSLSQRYEERVDQIHVSRSAHAFSASHIMEFRQGRPRFDVSRGQLEYLSTFSFSWTEIASLLRVSRMTVYRRRGEFNLLTHGRDISDEDLRTVVRGMQTTFPNMGETMFLGQLRSLDYSVTRERVRHVIRDLDPLNIALRSPRGLTARRPYSVPGPNSLWHIGMSGYFFMKCFII